jgi:hypothetical protein
MTTDFDPLLARLDQWQTDGRVARFWLRDDDAVAPTPALRALMALTARYRVPLGLAVIPAPATPELAALVGEQPEIAVLPHGWSHHNHAGRGEKKQELGRHRPAEAVLGELGQSLDRLRHLFGPRTLPVLVPPWNRIDAALLPYLGPLGYRAVSVFGPEKPGPLAMVNTHADIMDWHGTRGCRPAGDIVADIVARLDRMEPSRDAMGLLTHHLVHDAAAWDFLETLFAVTTGHPACRWAAPGDLMPPPAA